MFKKLYTNGRYRPVAVCCSCGEVITDGSMAMVLSRNHDRSAASPLLDVSVVHKGSCDDLETERLGGHGVVGSTELTTYLRYLCDNTGLDLAGMQAQNRLDDEIGTL